MRETPRLTVGICNYNYGQYLPECIKSAEKFADEIVVYDDASTDDSRDVLASSCHRVIMAKRNSGSAVRGYNELIRAARGEYLMILDADNLLLDVPELSADYTYGDILLMDASGNPTGGWVYEGWPEDTASAIERFKKTLSMPVPAGGFWLTEALRRAGMEYTQWPSTGFGADFATMMKRLEVGFSIHRFPGYILGFRQHDGQQTSDADGRTLMMRDVAEYAKGLQ